MSTARSGVLDAGVVDQQVEAAERLAGLGERADRRPRWGRRTSVARPPRSARRRAGRHRRPRWWIATAAPCGEPARPSCARRTDRCLFRRQPHAAPVLEDAFAIGLEFEPAVVSLATLGGARRPLGAHHHRRAGCAPLHGADTVFQCRSAAASRRCAVTGARRRGRGRRRVRRRGCAPRSSLAHGRRHRARASGWARSTSRWRWRAEADRRARAGGQIARARARRSSPRRRARVPARGAGRVGASSTRSSSARDVIDALVTGAQTTLASVSARGAAGVAPDP